MTNTTTLSPNAISLLKLLVENTALTLMTDEWQSVINALEDGEVLALLGVTDADQDAVEELYRYAEEKRDFAHNDLQAKVLEARDNCKGNGVSINDLLIEFTNVANAEVDDEGDCWAGRWLSEEEARDFLTWLDDI